VVGDTSAKGRSVFRGDDNREQLTQLGASVGWAQKSWQIHTAFSYAERDKELSGTEKNSQGVTDPSLAVVKEIGTGHFGHRVYSFIRHTFAVGDSVYESRAAGLGLGRDQTGLGALYMWNGRFWDAQVLGEAHLGHATTRSEHRLSTQPGGSMGAGMGRVKGRWRLGSLVTTRFEGASKVTHEGQTTATERSQVWDTSFSLGRQIDAFQNAGITYVDQTILGPARNTTLSRTIALLWQYRW
jgi:hypothetical protein